MAKKIWRTETDTNIGEVNMEDGNLIRFKQKKVCETQEEFIKIYFDSINELTGGLEDGLYAVMFAVWKCSSFSQPNDEGNKFYNTPMFKEECRNMGIKLSDNAINTAITRLEKRGVIKRLQRGCYLLNPKYFVKGILTSKTRMELCIEFNGGVARKKRR